MKIIFTLFLIAFITTSHAQLGNVETVGNPSTSQSVSSYTGWVNNGVFTFSGDAEVQNLNPSTSVNSTSSGGGNVYFSNTVGRYLEVGNIVMPYFSNFSYFLSINFRLWNLDTTNVGNNLVLEYSVDSGATYKPISYHRLGGSMFQSGAWSTIEAVAQESLPTISALAIKIKIRQISAIRDFRVDDIQMGFVVLMPSSFTNFNARNEKEKVNLAWSFFSVDGNEVFEIERSVNGVQFSSIATLKSKGVGVNSYSYQDNLVNTSMLYYRIKAKTAEGKIIYSSVIKVTNKEEVKNELVWIGPNPVRNFLNLQINAIDRQNAKIEILNSEGKLVLSQRQFFEKGLNSIGVDIAKLVSGAYFVKVNFANEVLCRQVVIR